MHGQVTLRAEAGGRIAAGRAPVRITVSDTGIGIPAEAVERLFEPFEQLDASMARRFGGTGLGLAIVQKLVRMMDGAIRVSSAVGEGTTFTIDLRLPVVSASAEISTKGIPAAGPPAASRPLAILIVEDNSVNRRLVRLMLERIGYDPDEAPDGPGAVDCAARRAYDLVLVDIQMPGMDGYETAGRIRALQPRAKIVALTAHALPADHARSAAEGMHAHLAKPVRLEMLRKLLENCAAFQMAPSA
jgi:CheY-like chemotaxis protein